jgi:hypothetical protein
MGMTRAYPLIILLILALGVPAAVAETDPGTINIMQPEHPAPKNNKNKRRGSSNPVYPTSLPAPQGVTPPPPSQQVVTPRPVTPPPIVVPQTGRALPNMPTLSGSGLGGAETGQDRAMRCAHQAGAYGDAAGNRNAYIGSCINQ